MTRAVFLSFVIPAKSGNSGLRASSLALDARFRVHDELMRMVMRSGGMSSASRP